MKKFVLFLVAVLLGCVAISQKTIDYKGKTYYVYPHNVTVTGMPYYAKSYKKFVKQYKETYQSWIDEASGEEKQKLIDEREDRLRKYTQFSRGKRKINEWVDKCKNKNLVFLTRPNYRGFRDIKPSLDPLPDGDYVQLFDPILLANGKGIDSNIVAGVFTIKNNVMEGSSIWFYLNGDTLVTGNYSKGLKTGKWLSLRKRNRYVDPDAKKRVSWESYRYSDYSNDKVTEFKNGMKHGASIEYFGTYDKNNIKAYSEYNEDVATGTWLEYKYDFRTEKYNLTSKQTHTDSAVFVKGSDHPIVRTSFMKRREFHYVKVKRKSIRKPLDSMKYHLEFRPSEILQKISREEYEAKSTNDIMNYRYSRRFYSAPKYYIAKFKDTVYEWYPNGQLKWMAIIKNGILEKEPDLFYDNGQLASKVEFNADSNKFFTYEYSFKGELEMIKVYDSVGKFLYKAEEFRKKKVDFIFRGIHLEASKGQSVYQIKNEKLPLEFDLPDTNYLSLKVNIDSTIARENAFYPKEFKYSNIETYFGDTIIHAQYVFDSAYTRFSGTKFAKWENISLISKVNGTENEVEIKHDSLPAYQFLDYGTLREYDITSDNKIFIDDKPFNGEVIVKFEETKNKGIKIKHKPGLLEIYLSNNKYFKKKKVKDPNYDEDNLTQAQLLSLYNERKEHFQKYPGYHVVADIIKDVYDQINFSNSSSEFSHYRSRDNYSFNGIVENGKLNGRWNVYGDSKEIEKTYDFVKGEYHGQIIKYEIVRKSDYYKRNKMYYDDYDNLIGKKLPVKFIREVKNLENDHREGKLTTYDILGNTVEEFNYENDVLHGPGYVKGDFFYVKENYNLGRRDGKMEIFMTYGDTLLMSDLHFQNGDLSGKSTIYHENGRVAKQGFFLDGKPIETYEAYDSTGQLYHYVKFKYGFAVEEKIWEENQLSAKYEMDWEDSVFFNNFKFITNDNYVDKILYNIGGMGRNYYKPYKGRPSMIDKEDVAYYLTKYYPDNTMAREGRVNAKEEKEGVWDYYHYNGNKLYSVHYGDSTIKLNDSVLLHTYGKYYQLNADKDTTMIGFITDMDSKYDCANTDHYEIRQFYFPNKLNTAKNLIDGEIKHYYDNGVLQNEGKMKDGLPVGVWKFYDPYGKLNQVGEYENGLRQGRWLKGDLAKIKFLGDICLNPNMPNLEEEISKREKQLDVSVHYFDKGEVKNSVFFDLDLNKKRFDEGQEFDYYDMPNF